MKLSNVHGAHLSHLSCTRRQEDGEPQAMMCGGPDTWTLPAGVTTDTSGAAMVADTATGRVHIVSEDWQFVGELATSQPLAGPAALALHPATGQLAVHSTSTGALAMLVLDHIE